MQQVVWMLHFAIEWKYSNQKCFKSTPFRQRHYDHNIGLVLLSKLSCNCDVYSDTLLSKLRLHSSAFWEMVDCMSDQNRASYCSTHAPVSLNHPWPNGQFITVTTLDHFDKHKSRSFENACQTFQTCSVP